jgi:hypothetical protein
VQMATQWLAIGVTVTLLSSVGAAQSPTSSQTPANAIIDFEGQRAWREVANLER